MSTPIDPKHYDIIHTANLQLEFIGRMLLAWDTDDIQIEETEKQGLYYTIECIRKELEPLLET